MLDGHFENLSKLEVSALRVNLLSNNENRDTSGKTAGIFG